MRPLVPCLWSLGGECRGGRGEGRHRRGRRRQNKKIVNKNDRRASCLREATWLQIDILISLRYFINIRDVVVKTDCLTEEVSLC